MWLIEYVCVLRGCLYLWRHSRLALRWLAAKSVYSRLQICSRCFCYSEFKVNTKIPPPPPLSFFSCINSTPNTTHQESYCWQVKSCSCNFYFISWHPACVCVSDGKRRSCATVPLITASQESAPCCFRHLIRESFTCKALGECIWLLDRNGNLPLPVKSLTWEENHSFTGKVIFTTLPLHKLSNLQKVSRHITCPLLTASLNVLYITPIFFFHWKRWSVNNCACDKISLC